MIRTDMSLLSHRQRRALDTLTNSQSIPQSYGGKSSAVPLPSSHRRMPPYIRAIIFRGQIRWDAACTQNSDEREVSFLACSRSYAAKSLPRAPCRLTHVFPFPCILPFTPSPGSRSGRCYILWLTYLGGHEPRRPLIRWCRHIAVSL